MRLRDLFGHDAALEPQAEADALEGSGLAVDSRTVKPGDLFFALAGSKTDGSRFIDAAIASGAVAVACEHAPAGERRVPIVVTSNPRSARRRAAERVSPKQTEMQ